MSGPLEGTRVVELAHWAAVPAAMAILSDWGASVIKVEDPLTGDPYRGHVSGVFSGAVPSGPGFELVNRNKRSIAIDLRHERGRRLLYRLVEAADIFATNFQLPELERCGARYDEIAGINPRIVYVNLTGYGEVGPDRERPGYDNTAFWARSGIMASLGEPDTPPVGPRPGQGDRSTSTAIAAAVLAALLSREKTGIGQQVSTALVHCGMWQVASDLIVAGLTGKPVLRASRKAVGNPLINCYQAKDQLWLQLCMPQADRYWPGLCQALDRPDIEVDPRFASLAARQQNAVALVALLDDVFLTRDRAEWCERLERHGCIWAKVQEANEVMADEQLWANGFLARVPHPGLGEITLVSAPGKFSRTPGCVRTAAPAAGQHTEEILLEEGYSWEEIATLKEDGTIL